MNFPLPEPSDRAVSVIALIQSAVIVGGTLFVSVMMKFYSRNADPAHFEGFRPAALFVRHFGFTLLLLPIAWAAGTLLAARSSSSVHFPRLMVGFGIAAILFGMAFFFILGFSTVMYESHPQYNLNT